ncbi:MAG: AAA family ATPase [Oscillospiraceae bacterium]
MLELLHIENIAIIDRADITFEPGFNALTGETGAGKSIVIDSLSAVLGQRTSRDLIRTGADKAYVSACFTGIPPEVGEDLGITWDEECCCSGRSTPTVKTSAGWALAPSR